MSDAEQRLARPRQIFLGEAERPYLPISERD
jgi:citrate synthase